MANMPQTKSVSVMFLPKSQSPPLLQVMSERDHGLQIRHSKSDPMIRIDSKRNGYKLSEVNPTLNESLLYPHWISSSSSSLSTMDPTINTEDSIYEMDCITLEGLRSLYNSCFECGVSWHQNHITLDCTECGGYSMSRPCPECDGKCESEWRRNLIATHENHRAIWTGVCKRSTSLRDSNMSSNSSNLKSFKS